MAFFLRIQGERHRTYIRSSASSSAVDFSKDLSLLTHLSAADIDRLQAVGRDAQAMQQHFILRDDQDKAWKHISSLKRGQIDFVLDNGLFLSLSPSSCLTNNDTIQLDSRSRPIHDPFGPSTDLAKLLYTALHRLGLCRLFGDVYALRQQSHISVSPTPSW